MRRSCPSIFLADGSGEQEAQCRIRTRSGERGSIVGSGATTRSVHVIRADSHDISTVEDVRRRLPGGKFDFLFIDGDHSYEGVRRDFELYSPLAEAGAFVAFHDIVPSVPDGHGDPGEVPVFWDEIRNAQTVEAEFVEDPDWGSCGIGVIRL